MLLELADDSDDDSLLSLDSSDCVEVSESDSPVLSGSLSNSADELDSLDASSEASLVCDEVSDDGSPHKSSLDESAALSEDAEESSGFPHKLSEESSVVGSVADDSESANPADGSSTLPPLASITLLDTSEKKPVSVFSSPTESKLELIMTSCIAGHLSACATLFFETVTSGSASATGGRAVVTSTVAESPATIGGMRRFIAM